MSQLDPVQIAALQFSEGKQGVGWFMQQGLGKTLCALTEFSFLYQTDKCDRMIVICPNTFKRGWQDEIEKHGFSFDVHIWRSSKKASAADFLNARHDKPPVLIVNYEAVRMPGVTRALQIWASRGSAYLTLDESITIKGHNSAQTKAVHHIAQWNEGEPLNCCYVRLLTGRPTTQGPHDLWGQLRAIGLFQQSNFYAFRGAFCEMGGWQNKEVLRAKNAPRLAELMAPVVFQAKKKDWLPALPRKNFTIRDYEMSGEQRSQYLQMEKDFLLEIEGGTVTVDVAIAKFAKLAQIQTGFIYDEQGDAHELVTPSANPRLNLLRQLLEEESEGKVVVVYRHRAVLNILLEALVAYSPAWIKGGMKPDEVEEQKARFNNEPHCRILLAQCDATKYGHTLCLQPEDDKCRTMIFFESSYSMDTRAQVEDRIHRRGQTGEYVLYIDLSGSPLDRRIVSALQQKDQLFRAVFRHLKESTPTVINRDQVVVD